VISSAFEQLVQAEPDRPS